MSSEKKYGYDRPERQIMIYSQYIEKEFPVIMDTLIKYESLNEQLVNKINNQEAKKFLEREIITRIYEGAKAEWSAVKEGYNLKIELVQPGDKFQCELCNQPIKNIYFIENKLTQKELRLGSECIKRYDINTGVHEGKNRDQYIKEQKNNANKIRRERIFNEHHPDARTTIGKWKETFENYPIMVPKGFHEEFHNIYSQANGIFNGFISGSKRLEDIRIFEAVKENMENLLSRIESYIREYEHDEWSVDRKIETWLLNKTSHTYKDIYDKLKINGKITLDTLPFIHEENFINRIARKLNPTMNALSLEIHSIDFSNSKFNLIYKECERILLNCSFIDILTLTAPIIFDLNYNSDLQKLKYEVIYKSSVDKESLEIGLFLLENDLNKKQLYIEWHGMSVNKVVLRYANYGYKIFALSEFVKINKNLILFGEKYSLNNLVNRFKDIKQFKPINNLRNEIADLKLTEEGGK